MTNFVKKHLPCPKCPSSDAYCIDDKGHGFCFSCNKFVPNGGASVSASGGFTVESKETSKAVKELEIGGHHRALNEKGHPLIDRCISKETCEFFDVKVTTNAKGIVDQVIYPLHSRESVGKELITQKIRTVVSPKGYWKGSPKESGLFGADKFKSGRTVTITEGEFDAMAFRDLCGDFPVVSINNGISGAVRDITKNLEYFENFKLIYICFDNEHDLKKREEVERVVQKVATLFPIGKVKIVNMRHCKDANEYLKKGLKREFLNCWHGAEDFTPAGIVFGTSMLPRIRGKLKDRASKSKVVYPYDELNKFTYGIRTGEMVTIVAGSGVGKSLFLSEIMSKILSDTTEEKIGIMMMEESVEMANLRLMSIHASKPFHLPDEVYTDKELEFHAKETIEKLNSEGDPRVISFDHFGSNSIDVILSKVDYMAALGCKYIFLDHISILVSDQSHGDERKALDEIATKLRMKIQERDIALFIVSHLKRVGGKPHEEGGETSLADIRGTAGIGHMSDLVIGLERHQQHEDDYLRNVTKMRVLKNRFSGLTGLSSCALYDHATGRLLEEPVEDVLEMEQKFRDRHKRVIKATIVKNESVFDKTPMGEAMKAERKD